ncbi:MAG: hypothetical protein AAFY60_21760, partial [Myxococcota bacterium]
MSTARSFPDSAKLLPELSAVVHAVTSVEELSELAERLEVAVNRFAQQSLDAAVASIAHVRVSGGRFGCGAEFVSCTVRHLAGSWVPRMRGAVLAGRDNEQDRDARTQRD